VKDCVADTAPLGFSGSWEERKRLCMREKGSRRMFRPDERKVRAIKDVKAIFGSQRTCDRAVIKRGN